MGNDQSVVEKYNTDAASGEEFYSADDEPEDIRHPQVFDDKESQAEPAEDPDDEEIPSEASEEEGENLFGEDGRPVLDPREACKSIRLLYSLDAIAIQAIEKDAEGDDNPEDGNPFSESPPKPILKKASWRKSVSKAFKNSGIRKAIKKSYKKTKKGLKTMRKSFRKTLHIKKKGSSGGFELSFNSNINPLRTLAHFETKHRYSQYLMHTLEAGMLVRCTLDYPYGLQKGTCGRYEGQWPAGPTTHGLFTWKGWEHPISGISTFALAWSMVELLDPRTTDQALLTAPAEENSPVVAHAHAPTTYKKLPVHNNQESKTSSALKTIVSVRIPGDGDESETEDNPFGAIAETDDNDDNPFGKTAETDDNPFGKTAETDDNPFGKTAETDDNPFGKTAETDDNPFGKTAETDDNPFGKTAETDDNPFGKPAEGSDNPFGKATKNSDDGSEIEANPFGKPAEGSGNPFGKPAEGSDNNSSNQVQEEDIIAEPSDKSDEEVEQEQVEYDNESAETADKPDEEKQPDSSGERHKTVEATDKSDDEPAESYDERDKSAEVADKSDDEPDESNDERDKSAEVADKSDDEPDEAPVETAPEVAVAHEEPKSFSFESKTESASPSVTVPAPVTITSEEAEDDEKLPPSVMSPMSPLPDFDLGLSDGDLSDEDDEERHMAHMKETLRPGMRVRTTEKYMANAPKKGCEGNYISKHETEPDYGMFVWDDYANVVTGTDRCVAPYFAVTLMENQPSAAEREAWIEALKKKDEAPVAEPRDKKIGEKTTVKKEVGTTVKKEPSQPNPYDIAPDALDSPKEKAQGTEHEEERDELSPADKTPDVRRELFPISDERRMSNKGPPTPPPPFSPPKSNTTQKAGLKKALLVLKNAQKGRAEFRGMKGRVKYRRLIRLEEESVERLAGAINAAKRVGCDTKQAELMLSKGRTALLTINDLNDARRMLKAAILVADKARCAFVVSALLEGAANHGMEATDPLIEQTFAVVQAIVEEESDFEEVLTETLSDMKLSLTGDTSNLNATALYDLSETNAVAVDVYKELASRLEDADHTFNQFATHASEELVQLAKAKRRHHERIRRKLRKLKQYSDQAKQIAAAADPNMKIEKPKRAEVVSDSDSDSSELDLPKTQKKKKKKKNKNDGDSGKKKKKKKKDKDGDSDKKKKKKKKKGKKKKDADGKKKKKRKKKKKKKPNHLFVGTEVVVQSSGGEDLSGIVRFNGTTDFHAGIWIGVELDVPKGKNDGSVAGKQYFKCEDKYGLFTQLVSCQAMNGTLVERLAAYYQTHAPEKVNQTAEILGHFVDKEQDLFAKLEQKYGEPVR